MSWRSWLTVGLAVAAMLAAWAIWNENNHLKTRGPAEYRPDYVLTDFTMVSLDERGKEALTVSAPQLRRNPDTQAMDLDTPTFLFPDRNNRRWRATSKTAWVSAKGEQVKLRGDAVIDSPTGDADQGRISSPTLDVFTEKGKERATTQDAVVITKPGTIIRGRGLDADFNQDRVVLHNEVRIQYAP
ncbi:MAG: LPS export ABC transporter periplasmic protein LptC [Proteobacteria bacterium]|nr:LPS export ABC transporter periplasmic protein LptC [Pseudomonadota bacterium]